MSSFYTEDEKALTLEQFNTVMGEINLHHAFANSKSKGLWVKYIRPNFDTRDGKCFHIKLDAQEFDSRQEGNMYDNIMKYLKENQPNVK